MVRLFVRHTVSDYGTWRKHYDAFDTGHCWDGSHCARRVLRHGQSERRHHHT